MTSSVGFAGSGLAGGATGLGATVVGAVLGVAGTVGAGAGFAAGLVTGLAAGAGRWPGFDLVVAAGAGEDNGVVADQTGHSQKQHEKQAIVVNLCRATHYPGTALFYCGFFEAITGLPRHS
jgi:hypothetical protein